MNPPPAAGPRATGSGVDATWATVDEGVDAKRDRAPTTDASTDLLPPALRHDLHVLEPFTGGGQGKTLLCQSNDRRMTVVVKRYSRPLDDPRDDPRAAWSALDRKHVVQFVEPALGIPAFGIESGTGMLWEVLEYLPEGTLEKFVNAHGGRLPSRFITPVVRQLTDALEHLHQHGRTQGKKGILHRDIKPSNILVRRRSPLDLVLADFGISVSPAATVQWDVPRGTLLFAAPERGHDSVAVDWWSLGMTLATVIGGVHPYAVALGREIAGVDPHMIPPLWNDPVSLDHIADENVRHLLRGLLTVEREDRWGAADVRAWLAGDPPPVAQHRRRPASRLEPMRLSAFGSAFTTPQQLAAAMAADWKAARRLDRGHQLKDLGVWLNTWYPERSIDSVLEQRAEHIARDSGPFRFADRVVAEVLVRLDPDRRPVFMGESVLAEDLIRLADRARQGSVGARAVVDRLYDLHALLAYDHHARHSELAATDGRWHRLVDQAETWYKTIGLAPSETMRPKLLALAAGRRPRSRRAAGEGGPEVSVRWYADLLNGRGAARHLDGRLRTLLIDTTASVARQAAEDERKEARRRAQREREQRRDRREQRAWSAAARRLPGDRAVLWGAVVVLLSAIVPLTIGSTVRRLVRHTPDEVGSIDAVALRALHFRDAFVYAVGDWALGAVSVLALAALVVLAGRWRFRRGRIVTAIAFLAAAVALASGVTPAWQQGDRAIVTTVRTTAYPALGCAARSAMTRDDGGATLIQYRVVGAGAEDRCDQVQIRAGWFLSTTESLPKGVGVDVADPEAFVILPGQDPSRTYGVLVTTDGRLRGARASVPAHWWSAALPHSVRTSLIAGTSDVLVLLKQRRGETGEIVSAATGHRLATLCGGGAVTAAAFDGRALHWRCGSVTHRWAEPGR